jgi:hypothetical protein
MATPNEAPDPTTTVPHDEPTESEAAGRTATTRKINITPTEPDPNTTVPHDDA